MYIYVHVVKSSCAYMSMWLKPHVHICLCGYIYVHVVKTHIYILVLGLDNRNIDNRYRYSTFSDNRYRD